MAAIIVIIFGGIYLYISFGPDNEAKNVAIFPMLKSCDAELNNFVKNNRKSNIDIKYVKYAFMPESHDDFSGVIIVRSDELSKVNLVNYFKPFIRVCYPAVFSAVDLNEKNSLDEFKKTIELNQLMGIKKQYIKLDNNIISVYYRDLRIQGEGSRQE